MPAPKNPEIFTPKRPVLRAVADAGGTVLIDEGQYQFALDPERGTLSARKAASWFRKGFAVWREKYAVLTPLGLAKADEVFFA